MDKNNQTTTYKRRIAPGERLFTQSPFSIVAVVARIMGPVSATMLHEAVLKARKRHPLLNSRIAQDDQGDPWFTYDGAGAIAIETIQRASDDQWMEVLVRERQTPFDFAARPPIRFILIQSASISEMIILCHHIICDGLSLAYLARDLLTHLGDPARQADETQVPLPVDLDSLPSDLGLNKVAKYLIGRINRRWQEEKMLFDQHDYVDLCQAYWDHFDHRCLSVELDQRQTEELVARCRRNRVTVNSALTAAFAGGQASVLGLRAYNAKLAVAVNVRSRLTRAVDEAMGFYASAVILSCRYDTKRSFWDNARKYHKAIRSRLDDKHVLHELATWNHLDPTILEAINYKKLGRLTKPHQPCHGKLSAFADRDDVVTRILKRDGQLALDRITVGTAITNLTRLDFPTSYGSLKLDRMMLVPGGAFPLVNCGLVLGAVTCADKLSLTIEYAEQAVSTPNMVRVRDEALGMLLCTE